VVEKLATLVVNCDLDATLRVFTEGGISARKDAPIGNVEWVTGRDRDDTELVGRRCRPTAAGPKRKERGNAERSHPNETLQVFSSS
jgi:hypothetical protein